MNRAGEARTSYTKGPRFKEYTRQALRDCGYPTLSLEEWCHFMNCGRTLAYMLAKNNEVPGLLNLGRKLRVSTAATLKTLGEGE